MLEILFISQVADKMMFTLTLQKRVSYFVFITCFLRLLLLYFYYHSLKFNWDQIHLRLRITYSNMMTMMEMIRYDMIRNENRKQNPTSKVDNHKQTHFHAILNSLRANIQGCAFSYRIQPSKLHLTKGGNVVEFFFSTSRPIRIGNKDSPIIILAQFSSS